MSEPLEVFSWYGEELKTMGDIFDEALRIIDLGDPYLATEFIDDYGSYLERVDPDIEDGRWVAMQNLGYFAGYYDRETADKVYDFFEVEHPFFGRSHPSPEEAFEMGKKWGEAMKEGRPFP